MASLNLGGVFMPRLDDIRVERDEQDYQGEAQYSLVIGDQGGASLHVPGMSIEDVRRLWEECRKVLTAPTPAEERLDRILPRDCAGLPPERLTAG
jgi:hypothetical protein